MSNFSLFFLKIYDTQKTFWNKLTFSDQEKFLKFKAVDLAFAKILRSPEQFQSIYSTVKGQNNSNLCLCFTRRHELKNKPLISNILFQVLLVVERKIKLVAMIGDETLKKYFQRKYIHTWKKCPEK